jgi:ribosome-associated protein
MHPPRLTIKSLLPWIEVRFSRSPGPGGQNINKTNTRVTLLFDLESCDVLTATEKARVRTRLRTRMSRDGPLRVVVHRERTQARNRAIAQDRLIELLSQAIRTRKPRRPTRPTPASRRRRLADKRKRSDLKRQRREVNED